VQPEEPGSTALDGIDLARIPIYCINLPASKDRRLRMERRFAEFGLLDRVRFISAVDRSSPLVDRHQERIGALTATERRRAEVACFLSHARTLRTFLRETPVSSGSAIIFEDDVLLHRDWQRRLERVLGNLPAAAPVCALGHLTFGSFDSAWVGLNPLQRNLIPMRFGTAFGSFTYWITRDRARGALEEFESDPGDEGFVSENLIWRPNGFVARPPLTVEDATPSTIVPKEDFEAAARQRLYRSWGIENYLVVEQDQQAYDQVVVGRGPQTICLCMIVRNESKVIDRLADSVRCLIDTWVICDTGSTDGTPERVLEAFKDVPGELFHDEWQDYGTNRTLMLDRARGRADYLLILDADHTLCIEGRLPYLDVDAYALLVDDELASWVPCLVRADLPWRYVGAAHEYITCDQPHLTELLPLLVVENHADGGNRSDKLRRVRELLERDFDRDPDNSHTVFYLAQTYREMAEDELAIQFYARRTQLGGWPEETFCAMYGHAELVSRTDWNLGVELLLATWESRPTRAEPLLTLAQGFRVRSQFNLGALFAAKGMDIGLPSDALLVHRDHYAWALEYEWSICAVQHRRLSMGALRSP
jgi:GR25 family glycosyltransferase involved in LPS biosynthesis